MKARTIWGRYPSGQREQTVNLLRLRFVGSNPALPTSPTSKENKKSRTVVPSDFLLFSVARDNDLIYSSPSFQKTISVKLGTLNLSNLCGRFRAGVAQPRRLLDNYWGRGPDFNKKSENVGIGRAVAHIEK